jgi:hypothetical protein
LNPASIAVICEFDRPTLQQKLLGGVLDGNLTVLAEIRRSDHGRRCAAVTTLGVKPMSEEIGGQLGPFFIGATLSGTALVFRKRRTAVFMLPTARLAIQLYPLVHRSRTLLRIVAARLALLPARRSVVADLLAFFLVIFATLAIRAMLARTHQAIFTQTILELFIHADPPMFGEPAKR